MPNTKKVVRKLQTIYHILPRSSLFQLDASITMVTSRFRDRHLAASSLNCIQQTQLNNKNDIWVSVPFSQPNSQTLETCNMVPSYSFYLPRPKQLWNSINIQRRHCQEICAIVWSIHQQCHLCILPLCLTSTHNYRNSYTLSKHAVEKYNHNIIIMCCSLLCYYGNNVVYISSLGDKFSLHISGYH